MRCFSAGIPPSTQTVRRWFPVVAIALVLTLPSIASAQTRQLTGRVTTTGMGTPLAGASISVENSPQATTADADGRYRLSIPAGPVTIVARHIGYKRVRRVVPAEQAVADFALDRDVLLLESVVVTGQATTVERRSATTSVATVSGAEINNVATPTIENALVGKISGVNIQSNSGAPGGGIQLQVRGNNTVLGSFDPLYVVDGVIYSNDRIASGRSLISAGAAGFRNFEDDAVNRVADIDPASIESIEILKGAAASSIYGSKAANGVVIITTKRGTRGPARVDARQRFGTFQLARKFETRRWTRDEAIATPRYGAKVAHWFDRNPTPYYNHFDQVFNDAGLSWETGIDVSGGNEATRYFMGGTWKRDDGIERGTGFARQTLRANLSQSLGQRLEVRLTSTYNRSEHDRGWNNNCNNYACHGYAFAYTPSFVDLTARDAAGNYITPDWGIQANSVQLTDVAVNSELTNRFTGGVTADFNAWQTGTQGLRLVAAFGVDAFHQNNELWTPNELFFERPQALPGSAIEGDGRSQLYNWNVNAIHNFTPAQGSWSLSTSAGVQYEDRSLEVSRITTTNLVPGQRNVDQGTNTVVNDDLTEERTVALYVQEDVQLFNDRLRLNAGLRAERSSMNGDIDKYYVFPKISAAYRLLDLLGQGSEIKPRIAYGETGNLPIFGQKFTVLGTPQLGGLSGFTIAELNQGAVVQAVSGSETVSPERTREIEVGVDGIAMNGRLTWELTGFARNTTNLLLTRIPAPSSGFTSQVFNGGRLQNTGIEAAIGATPIQARDVLWVTRGTFTRYRNEVKDLAGLPPFRPPLSGFGGLGVTFVEVGQPMTQIIGRGFCEDFPGQPCAANGIATQNNVKLGDSAPNYRLGFTNEVTYKAFTFSTVLDYQNGGSVINLTQYLYDDAATTADFGSPAYDYRRRGQLNGVITPYIEDASFLKLREVSVGVALPRAWVDRLGRGVSSARVSLSGRNLLTWQKYSGLDPEVGNLGSAAVRNNLDIAPYPPSRSYFLDIHLGF